MNKSKQGHKQLIGQRNPSCTEISYKKRNGTARTNRICKQARNKMEALSNNGAVNEEQNII
jgi:hypothetical protein